MPSEVPVELAFDTRGIKAALRRYLEAVVRPLAKVIVRDVVECPGTWTEGDAALLACRELSVESIRQLRDALVRELDQEIRSASTVPAQYLGSVGEAPGARSGPTSACLDCPALVAPENLWVGKKSGVGLCESCMERWEKAGRAKRSGDF